MPKKVWLVVKNDGYYISPYAVCSSTQKVLEWVALHAQDEEKCLFLHGGAPGPGGGRAGPAERSRHVGFSACSAR